MIKIILFMIAVSFSMAVQAQAQTFVESQTFCHLGKVSPTIDGQVIVPGKKADFTAWYLVSDGWGEALLGVSKSVKPWLWVGILAGVETDDNPFRVSPEIWMGKGRVSFYLVTEHGGSGYWYKNTGLVRIAPRLEVGYHAQRFYGVGPMVQVELGNKFSIWASAAATNKAIVGLKKAF